MSVFVGEKGLEPPRLSRQIYSLLSQPIAQLSQFRKGEDGSVDIPFYDWRYYDSYNSDITTTTDTLTLYHSPINLCTLYRGRTCDLLYVKQPLLPSELRVLVLVSWNEDNHFLVTIVLFY